MKFDIRWIRDEFPICRQKFPVPGHAAPQPIRYFDHGASTHPPRVVLETHREFLEKYYANIHRGHHNLSMIASDLFDRTAETVAEFLGADLSKQAVYITHNTTAALDLAAWAMSHVDGVVLTSVLEHHSNDLPFRARGRTVCVGMTPDGALDMADLERKLAANPVKLVTVTGASNVTGWMPDIHRIARMAHAKGAKICVDGAQLLAHRATSLKPFGDPEHIDFFAAAGHKAYAPFGSAFLAAPRALMDSVPPYRPGGGTVLAVTEGDVLFTTGPDRHLGGTPNIPGAIAMAKAIRFLQDIGLDEIRLHEIELTRQLLEGLCSLDGVTVYGPADPEARLGVVSFNVDGVHHDLAAAILNNEAVIATRNGCFCAHPYLHHLLGVKDVEELVARLARGEDTELPGAVRASIGLFNTPDEVDWLISWVGKLTRREWTGRYDLEKRDYCKPVFFEFDGRTGLSGASQHATARV
ncbi:MAG: aminotransferase class V-fold PLP-dependent enzyme [Candidatus Eiseniibacteriota bacterium]